MIFFLISVLLESFLRAKPRGFNISINVDHEFENTLKNIFEQEIIFLHDAWLSLNNCDDKFKRLLSDWGICEVLISNHWLEGGIDTSEMLFEETRLDFGEFVEVNKCIFEYSFILSRECTGNNLHHIRKKVHKSFGVASFCCSQKVHGSLKCGKFYV